MDAFAIEKIGLPDNVGDGPVGGYGAGGAPGEVPEHFGVRDESVDFIRRDAAVAGDESRSEALEEGAESSAKRGIATCSGDRQGNGGGEGGGQKPVFEDEVADFLRGHGEARYLAQEIPFRGRDGLVRGGEEHEKARDFRKNGRLNGTVPTRQLGTASQSFQISADSLNLFGIACHRMKIYETGL